MSFYVGHHFTSISFSVAGDRIALLVNNMGATSDLELNIVVRESIMYLGNLCVVSLLRAGIVFC